MAQLMLVELVTVKNAMDMPESVVDKDAVLTSLILGVSADFQRISDRIVDVEAQSEVFDVEEFTRSLKLRAWPVDSTAEFKIFHDTSRAFTVETEVDTSEYYLTAETGKVDLFSRYAASPKSLKVTYTGGMAKMTAPDPGEEFWNLYPDIAEAVIIEVIENFKKIPNLGAAVVRIGQDWTQMRKLGDRSERFKRMSREYSRMII